MNTFEHLFHEIITEGLFLSRFYLFHPKTAALVNETKEKRKEARDAITVL